LHSYLPTVAVEFSEKDKRQFCPHHNMKTYGGMEVKFLIFSNPAPAEDVSSPSRFFQLASWDSPLYPLVGGWMVNVPHKVIPVSLFAFLWASNFIDQRLCFRHSHV